MGKINRIPRGLLDLLQSKTDGKNPQDLAESVAPVLELSQFYLAERASFEFFPTVVQAIGSTTFVDVSEGEIWLLYAIDTEWISAALTNILQLSVEISRFADAASPLSAVTIFAPPTDVTRVIGEVHTRSIVFDRPLPLTSGMRVRAIAGDFVGPANITTVTNVAIYRLKI